MDPLVERLKKRVEGSAGNEVGQSVERKMRRLHPQIENLAIKRTCGLAPLL